MSFNLIEFRSVSKFAAEGELMMIIDGDSINIKATPPPLPVSQHKSVNRIVAIEGGKEWRIGDAFDER